MQYSLPYALIFWKQIEERTHSSYVADILLHIPQMGEAAHIPDQYQAQAHVHRGHVGACHWSGLMDTDCQTQKRPATLSGSQPRQISTPLSKDRRSDQWIRFAYTFSGTALLR